MTVDFASMQVGEQRELPSGSWESVRPIYEECLAYTKTVTPSPQFEFDKLKERTSTGRLRWIVRRTR